jgi:hypothetical protein
MSADNGIYILVLKDQCRVTEAGAIDNLYWWHNGNDRHDINACRVVEYFSKAKVLPDLQTADAVAVGIEDGMVAEDGFATEYGICQITDLCDKTWEEVVREARSITHEEIAYLRSKNYHGRYDYSLEQLNKVLHDSAHQSRPV